MPLIGVKQSMLLVIDAQRAYDWLRTVTGVREFFRANRDLAEPPGFSL